MTTPKAQPLEALARAISVRYVMSARADCEKDILSALKQARSEGFAAGIEKAAQHLEVEYWDAPRSAKSIRALTEDGTDG
jgi:hypothetical protein